MPAGKPKQKNMVKARLLVLARMFYEKTDPEHPMTGAEILEYLQVHGVPANEKTLRGDIELLQELGLDIVKVVSRPNLFYWGTRQFEVSELRLLIDAAASSRFITKKKSAELTQKLELLVSENQRKELRRHIQAANRVKKEDEEHIMAIDIINEAISRKKKVRFQYADCGPDLKEILPRDGGELVLSPYLLLWDDRYSHVIGWTDGQEKISLFRTDRIRRAEVLSEKAKKRPDGFTPNNYLAPVFDVSEGAERVSVKLEVANELAGCIADRFGTRIQTEQISEERFTVTVEVPLCPAFYAWVFRFAGDIRILSPKKAVSGMEEIIMKQKESL